MAHPYSGFSAEERQLLVRIPLTDQLVDLSIRNRTSARRDGRYHLVDIRSNIRTCRLDQRLELVDTIATEPAG
jgi:hypothetical protein